MDEHTWFKKKDWGGGGRFSVIIFYHSHSNYKHLHSHTLFSHMPSLAVVQAWKKRKKSHKPVSDHSHPVKKSAFFYHHSKLLVHHAVSMPDWDLQNPTNSVAFFPLFFCVPDCDLQNPTNSVAFFPLFFCVLANRKSYEHSVEFRTKGKVSSTVYAILKNKK